MVVFSVHFKDDFRGIYGYWNKLTREMIYVGQSVHVLRRNYEHRLDTGKDNQVIDRFIQAHPSRIALKVLYRCDKATPIILDEMEKILIKKYGTFEKEPPHGFNFTEGGSDGCSGENNHMWLGLPEDEICERYINGGNSVQLAKSYGCTHVTITKLLRRNGVELRDKSNCNTLNLPNEEICEKYIQGKSSHKIANEYDCTPPTILRILKKNNIPLRPAGHPNVLNLPEDKICREYCESETIPSLAKLYNCGTTPIHSILKRNGISKDNKNDFVCKKLV